MEREQRQQNSRSGNGNSGGYQRYNRHRGGSRQKVNRTDSEQQSAEQIQQPTVLARNRKHEGGFPIFVYEAEVVGIGLRAGMAAAQAQFALGIFDRHCGGEVGEQRGGWADGDCPRAGAENGIDFTIGPLLGRFGIPERLREKQPQSDGEPHNKTI